MDYRSIFNATYNPDKWRNISNIIFYFKTKGDFMRAEMMYIVVTMAISAILMVAISKLRK